MEPEKHYRNLEAMYKKGPINAFFDPQITVSRGAALIECEVQETFQHAAGGLHGCVYFKMLDDAAYFAAASREREYFLVTVSFQVYLMRSVPKGLLRAQGKLIQFSPGLIVAEAELVDLRGREIARGSGTFAKSPVLIESAAGYGSADGHS